MTATMHDASTDATIPHPSTDHGRPEGKRIQVPPRGTIKRAITIMCPRDQVMQAWRNTEFPQDADFSDAPGDRGTVITVVIPNAAPKTALGSAFESLMRDNPADAVEKALRHFKELTETGEIPSTDGQPSGKR